MSEILGLGLSHFPGPLVPAEYWPRMLPRNVQFGRIPQALYDDKSRWPAAMLAEWGDDEGLTAAREHQRRLISGYARLRQELDNFAPDFVLIWGDDQYENFKQDCVPPFCVYMFDELVSKPYNGAKVIYETDINSWGLPPDTELSIIGHPEGGRNLCANLLDQGFDVAYAYTTRHPAGLAHSFNNTLLFLDYERKGFPYPVVPFHVNCYGNQLIKMASDLYDDAQPRVSPPAPTPKRCFELGGTVARILKESPYRVALIASSSWSHGSLTAKHERLYPDIDADRALHRELVAGRFSRWGSIDPVKMEESGQHEVLNWICLAGAMTELGQKAEVVDFVESHVFNSSKCFAYFPPALVSA